MQDGFFPVGPIFFEEELAVLRRGAFSERPIKGPNGPVNVSAEALMHRVNVAEGGGIEKDGVPGGFGAARLGIALEGEIGSKPGRINKIVEPREIFQKIRGEKGGSGEDDEFGLKFRIAGEDAGAAARLGDATHHLAGANVCADVFEEATGDPAVAFRPGERAIFFGLAGRKIVNAGPCGGIARERAVVVAASVIHVPVQKA